MHYTCWIRYIFMQQVYSQFSKEQLIARLLTSEREKQRLMELLDLKDQQIKHEKQQEVNKIHELTNIISQLQSGLKITTLQHSLPATELNKDSKFFDLIFSEEYYDIQENGCKAIWKKASSNNFYSDYPYWPSVRSKQLITGTKSFKLTIPGYGWIGFGTSKMKNDGFPGYTTEGWMLCTDGRVFHNKDMTARNTSINFNNKTVTVIVDAPNSMISIDGVSQKMGDNCPKQVYFVVSIYGTRAAYVIVEP